MRINPRERLIPLPDDRDRGMSAGTNESADRAWRRTSFRDSTAQPEQPRLGAVVRDLQCQRVLLAVGIPAGRPKIDKAWKDMSREELLSLFEDAAAWNGSYTLNGTTLTRTTVSSLSHWRGCEARADTFASLGTR